MKAPKVAGAVKGLKAALPVKPCQHCGRPMGWRKRWARCWDEVRHCSAACRRQAGRRGGGDG
ncbi:DUF2256 domain-containing protein [Ideonella dechloratans]|uniref:DUF2256 domain-containing protein n=1 Tax=Ideonella dechloratans TaxID=36863 RepID=A0A643F4K3_IDEDE|nr:DUF2256 domain-containing protein [Ideonella dechloratans]KAB0572782.1 DUF2256 domain-containing protein [Ideonella dechloratans]UFU09535.1 DUF2256 domain-containing protein [Ideonella dechloratans]